MNNNKSIIPANSIRRFRPALPGTALIVISSLLITFVPSGNAYDIAHQSALIMGITIIIVSYMEFRKSPKNLIRVDLLMIVALYGLVLLEFLFAQPDIDRLVHTEDLRSAMYLVAIGFAGISIGSQWPFKKKLKILYKSDVTSTSIFIILLICTVIGYFHMLLSVNFNPVSLIDNMLGPRFSQPWGRGRYGGLIDLIHELGLLIYMIPPIAGVILARKENYTNTQIIITRLLLIFTLFSGFASGTRNIFAVYIISYVCSYIMMHPRLKRTKLIQISIIYSVILFISAQLMLDFRQEGFSKYVSNIFSQDKNHSEAYSVPDRSGLFIDYNLLTLVRTVKYFPEYADYLGLEVPYWAVVKPFPRAFWPGKPKGLSISIESVRNTQGAEAATWSATFLGESYMGGGYFGAGIAAFLFGVLAAWWNRRFVPGANVYQNLLYASGIFAALISMRSLFWFTTAILPTIALIIYFTWFVKQRSANYIVQVD